MRWPLKWFTPVETALNVYGVLTSVKSAMGRLEGEALAKWQTEHFREVRMALSIERMRDETDDGN